MASAYEGLRPQHRLFVDEFLIDLHQTNAYIRAGYSAKSAKAAANHLMDNPDIRAAIKERMDARAKRTEIDQDWVIRHLAAIAGANMLDVASWSQAGVFLKDSEDLSRDEAYVITEVKSNESIKQTGEGEDLVLNREVKAKLSSERVKALELLGKHLGLFNDKLQVSDGPIKGFVKVENYNDDRI